MDLPAPSTAQRDAALALWQRNMEIGLTTPPRHRSENGGTCTLAAECENQTAFGH